ncbi:hypothetical protein Clacol_008748 [Clathrus columnatus]|uniref:AB hydrolase-1 domain-containing protein n=1 Tax=Clathrus columnatus TaxID=1419009 RepID=A0AAV5AP73_9AGAM|nr:hypothetical protein Clacol_008748 [Clathrus columnatus]
MSTSARINGMEYTSFLPPKSPLPAPSFPIRRIIPLGEPPIDKISFPTLPTIRQGSEAGQPFTFYTASPSQSVKYKLTTHLYPSAYPRSPYRFGSTPVDTTEYTQIGKEEKKDVREKMFTKYMTGLEDWAYGVNHALEGGCDHLESYESACATQKRVMWNSVNRIVRDDLENDSEDVNRERLTLFVAHANGFPKETWEPSIRSLLSQLEASASENDTTPIIEEIWIFEAVQHGDTGLINAGLLTRAYDWLDNVRDILQFLLYYIPDRVERGPKNEPVPLPTHLTRLPESTATHRIKEGFDSRTVVGVGHSFGGCSVARVATEYPSLFSSLVLVDPVVRPIAVSAIFNNGLAESALKRRNFWKSKEEARTLFFKSPFFKAWNHDVLNAYIEHGIVEEGGIAKLKMNGLHETILFLHRQTTLETWNLLPQLNSRIPLFWVVSGLDGTALGGQDVLPDTVWRRPDNSSNVVLPVGHLIPHEAPIEFDYFKFSLTDNL